MYNETIKYIKTQYASIGRVSLSYRNLRTIHLRHVKDNIRNNSVIPEINHLQTKVQSHILDAAIKSACASYKSCLTNFKRGNIRHFRIRYKRFNSRTMEIEVEKTSFRNSSPLRKILELGSIKYDGELFNLDDIINIHKSACKIHYDRSTNKYTLLVATKIKPKNPHNYRNEIISMDPGIRTFMTGISDCEVVKLGNNVSDKIVPILRRNNRLKNLFKNGDITERFYRKKEKRNNLKITHLVGIWSQSEDLITILSDLDGKVKIGKDMFDENFSAKYNLLIFSRFLFLPSH